MTVYSLFLEEAPGEACAVHVGELPGCQVVAADFAGAESLLSDRIRSHRMWRLSHGLLPLGDEQIDWTVTQRVTGPHPWRSNGSSALFSIDRQILTDEEIDLHLRLLACGRADLLRAIHEIPRAALEDQPPGMARSLRDTLGHLADFEVWLLSRIGRRADAFDLDPIRRLVDVRARSLEHIGRYDRQDRDLIFVPRDQPSDDPDEMWSLRKVLRRLLEHELEHLDDVANARNRWGGGAGSE